MADGGVTAALAVPFATAPGGAFPVSVRVAGPAARRRAPAMARLRGMVSGVADALPAGVLLVPADGVPHGLYLVDVPAAGRGQGAGGVAGHDPAAVRPVVRRRAAGTLIASGPAAARPWRRRWPRAPAMLAAEQVGLAQRCLDMTVAYVKERHQFARPVGSFQALKHRLADLWVAISQARAASRYAAACLAAGDPDAKVAVALAKALLLGGRGARRAGMRAVARRHRLHLGTPRAPVPEAREGGSIAFGTPDAHRAALAALVDLPAS